VLRTLGILEEASLRGLLDLPIASARLQTTTFYAPSHVISDMLARHAARQSPLRGPEAWPYVGCNIPCFAGSLHHRTSWHWSI